MKLGKTVNSKKVTGFTKKQLPQTSEKKDNMSVIGVVLIALASIGSFLGLGRKGRNED